VAVRFYSIIFYILFFLNFYIQNMMRFQIHIILDEQNEQHKVIIFKITSGSKYPDKLKTRQLISSTKS